MELANFVIGPSEGSVIPKLLKTHDFGNRLKKIYPDIEQIFACRVVLIKGFVRSEFYPKKLFK